MMGLGFFRRIGWFGVIGVASSALYAAGTSAGVDLFGWSRMTANTFGLLLSTPCSYLGHHYLTFRADADHQAYVPRFLIQACATYFLASAMTWLGAQLGFNYLVGIFCVIVLIPLFNYIVLASWVFVGGRSSSLLASAPPCKSQRSGP
jgi:putative flippase GtrA